MLFSLKSLWSCRSISLLLIFAFIFLNLPTPSQAENSITLSQTTSPTAGQPGVHKISLTGSGFPSGSILASSVSVKFEPAPPGNGPTASTAANTVTTVVGSSRKIGFTIPTSLVFTSPAPYLVSISGVTTSGAAFSSSNKALLTINPLSKIIALDPASINPGETLSVSITTQYTDFVQGATMASFGPGISVGGAAENTFGKVTVISPTQATASIVVSPSAPAGFHTVTISTGNQTASLSDGFEVVKINQPPSFAPIESPQNMKEATTMAVTVTATNPSGEPLVLTASNLPSFANFKDNGDGTGTLSCAPGYRTAGSYTISFTATDSSGLTASASLEIIVSKTETTPVFNDIPGVTVKETEAVSFQVSATDQDGDTLIYSASGMPPGASFDPSKCTFSWTPAYGQAGMYNVTFSVTDGQVKIDKEVQVTVVKNNRPPVITTVSLPDGRMGTPYSAAIATQDPDNDTLNFTLVSGPSGLSIDASTGVISWLPNATQMGDFSVSINVDDGNGGADQKQYTIHVPDTIAPSININAPKEVIPGATFSVTVGAADNVAVSSITIDIDGSGQTNYNAPAGAQSFSAQRDISVPSVATVGSSVTINTTATDTSGNSSQSSSKIRITAVPDTEAPQVSISAPAKVPKGGTITITASATDNVGVAGIVIYSDNSEIANSSTSNASATFQIDPAAKTGTSIQLRAEALDFSGNLGTANINTVVTDFFQDTTPPVVSLTAPATVSLGSKLALNVQASDPDDGISKIDLYINGVQTASFMNSPGDIHVDLPHDTKVGDEILVEARASDFFDNIGSKQASVLVIAPQKGVITGKVYDDAKGLPLAGCTITFTKTDGTAATPILSDENGRYSITDSEVTGDLSITKDGYTTVVRPGITIKSNSGTVVFDARLTPLGGQQQVTSMMGGTLKAQFTAASSGLALALSALGLNATSFPVQSIIVGLPGGALSNDSSFSLSYISPQGLQSLLPIGWAPVNSFDLIPHGINFALPVSVNAPNLLGVKNDAGAVLAIWNSQSKTWNKVSDVQISDDGKGLIAAISSSGQFAFVIPDNLPLAPPVPAMLDALQPVSGAKIPDGFTATVSPQPKIIILSAGRLF